MHQHFVDYHLLSDMNFNGHCLIKNNISIPKKVINLYISYSLGHQLKKFSEGFASGNYVFGSMKLTKNANLDKCKHTGYGIEFDSLSEFLSTDRCYGKNVIIFGGDMSSSVHVNNKGKDILILGEGSTQGSDDTTLTAEAKLSIDFTQSEIGFVLSLHCNGSNSFLFVNATKVYQFKAKDSEIKDYALRLGNISKDFTTNNLTKIGFVKEVFFC